MKQLSETAIKQAKESLQIAFMADGNSIKAHGLPPTGFFKEAVKILTEQLNIKETESIEPFYLVNAQELANTNPFTFSAPSLDEFKAIKKNDYVKVCINNVERPWVLVKKINRKTLEIKGVIGNDLVFSIIHGKKCDDKITLNFNNIYLIQYT